MKDYIDAAAFRNMVLCAGEALAANEERINELNVFPVPDGDTGTNMSLTMQNAAKEAGERGFQSITEAADCVAGALLRGARGNSGVILSLLFRGMSKRFKGIATAGTTEFAGALEEGVAAAYKAVMKPAEGTILTVSRCSAEAAVKAASLGADMEGVFICAIKAAREALAETQSINPVLKKAGVVDAGGKGYVVILETMLASFKGEISPGEKMKSGGGGESGKVFSLFGTEEITFAYDTVFIVRKQSPSTDVRPFRSFLAGIGDSLVISEGDEEFKVHVHTDIPGSALTEAQKYGSLELAKIENMKSQHEAVAMGEKARTADDLDEHPAPATEECAESEKAFGTVAVCAGDGLKELFRELGCDEIVTGGQTMNPSTDDILTAISRTPADTVIILPNNKNIIMAAQQCIALSRKKVIVLPTRTVPQGITAMLNFDPELDADTLANGMAEAAEKVHTAMVTYAARDSDFDGREIHSGELLALLDGALLGSFTEEGELLEEMCRSIEKLCPEYITVYYGTDSNESGAQKVADRLEKHFPESEISMVNGGQPVYYYMIAIE